MTDTPEVKPHHLLELARETLDIEAQAVRAVAERLDAGFALAVALVLACKGRVVVSYNSLDELDGILAHIS